MVTHIGQGGMVDDWWQSAPGKITTPPTLIWESGGGGSVAIFSVNSVTIIAIAILELTATLCLSVTPPCVHFVNFTTGDAHNIDSSL